MDSAEPVIWDPEKYVRALRFAASAHHTQTVPGTESWSPKDGQIAYLFHLSLVSAEVMRALAVERFADPDLAVLCAALHDTIEDTDATYETVAAEFGGAVADGVRALSKDPSVPKAEQMPDSLARIREQPREVWLVKLADRITNLQPPPPKWSREKCMHYREQAQRIHDELGQASPFLRDRIAAKIAHYPLNQ